MENEVEYRMYGFVPYNLSPIQQGIQFGHAVVEFGQYVKGLSHEEKIYNTWANYNKTFIILNGGTTNNNPERLGLLNKYREEFLANEILFADFYEPDLGDQLTAFVYLVDDRVWNKEKYPDYVPVDYLWEKNTEPSFDDFMRWQAYNNLERSKWVKSIGGEKNLFLREFLVGKRTA
jgi:hypothetical protein